MHTHFFNNTSHNVKLMISKMTQLIKHFTQYITYNISKELFRDLSITDRSMYICIFYFYIIM